MFKKKRGISKKAQTWSVDLIVGIVIFLLIVVTLYALLSSKTSEKGDLRVDSDKTITRLTKGNNNSAGLPGVIDGENIDTNALIELYSSGASYEEIKRKLGIDSDVCIVLVDDTGGIISIDIGGGTEITSFGNTTHNLEIAPGINCGE